jgi:hypothetical protein
MQPINLLAIRPCRFFLALCLSTIATFLTLSPQALAYHHFYVKNGAAYLPVKWQTLSVRFIVDNGPTDILPEIQTAVDTWNNITTAKDVLAAPTRATVDFNGANFEIAWGKLTNDGQQEVILDENGTAFAAAGLDPASVNGYGPTRKQIVGGQGAITDAFLLLNGTRSNFDRRSTEVHELGHIQGLAHSSVGMNNSAGFPSDALDPISVNSVPTMHPFSIGTSQNRRTLEPDDIASLSELYPEATFTTAFGSIEGTVKRCATGNASVTGANVRAVNVSNSNIQLSRFTGFDGNSTGRFVINGLPPGTYKLIVEPMGANGFTINRFGSPPLNAEIDFPTEYHNPPDEESCTEEIPDTPVNIVVSAGGLATDKNFKVGSVSLAFVVDDTGSMSPEIAGVRQVLTQFVNILDTLNRTIGTPFPNTTIITFKDNVTKRLISNNPARLRAVIDSLTASGGGDCAESSNAALMAAGRLLRNGGVAMLITDADSRPDGPNRNAVTQLYRSKSLTLSTLLSGSCSSGTSLESSDMNDSGYSESTNYDEYPPEPVLGTESSVRTFSEESIETGGVFTFIPGIKSGDTTETQRYVNTGTNIAVSSAVPAIALVTPADGQRGTTVNLEINGANTNFQSSSVVSIAGDGVTVNSRTINSPEKITANVTIAPGASLGFRDVTVTTNTGKSEIATGFGAFNVIAALTGPSITSVTPSQGAQGTTLNVAITGINTHFVNGTSVANFGSGITVNSTTVLNASSLSANITISPTATTSPRHVSVTTGTETANDSGVGFFMVIAPPPPIPRIILLNPVLGTQGQTLNVAITGENTHFVNGTSVGSLSGSNITVNSTTVTSPTSATMNITIAPNAQLGFRDVFVTTGGENAAILSAFQVLDDVIVQLSAPSYSASEGAQRMSIIVTRTGDISVAVTANYATSDNSGLNACSSITGLASARCDYATSVGTLRFAAGETSKTILIPIVDDAFAEGAESFTISLSNPSEASLGTPITAALTITDNDSVTGSSNPIDQTPFFVRQHYIDFLGREPDLVGYQGWQDILNKCGTTVAPPCDRIEVSSAFFRSEEFLTRGYFIYRFYPAALGKIPRYNEFMPDFARVSGFLSPAQLEANKVAFVQEFMTRQEFRNKYDSLTDPAAYVNALITTAGVNLPQKDALIADLQAGRKTRAEVLRAVADSVEVYAKYYNQAFVVMQYFGYLRRDPDILYLEWIRIMNETGGDYRVMINGFMNSIEYRTRFGQ